MTKENMSQEQFERIDMYLSGKMDSGDLEAFELEMKNNSSLKQSVEDIRTDILAIQEVSLRDTLEDIHVNMDHDAGNVETKIITKVNWIKKFAVAASIAVLVGMGVLWISKSNPSNERLFAEYYSPDPGLVTPMSSTHNYEFFRGMVDYKIGEYDMALKRWDQLLIEKPDNDSLNYFIASGLMAQDKSDQALPFLEKVIKTPTSTFLKEAYYFTALIEIKKGNIDGAIELLEKSEYDNYLEIIAKLNDQ